MNLRVTCSVVQERLEKSMPVTVVLSVDKVGHLMQAEDGFKGF